MRRKVHVTVGINDYPGANSDLSGCVNDALDMEAASGMHGYRPYRLLDSDATKANVVAAITEGLAQCRLGDRFLLSVSSHGTWVPDRDGDEADGRDEALCLYDYRDGGLLLDDEIHQLLSARRAGVRATVVSDSCFSGSVTRFAGPPAGVGRARFLPPVMFLDGPALRRAEQVSHVTAKSPSRAGAVLISGCADAEVSYDANFNGRPNGAMTYVLLQALSLEGSTKDVYARMRTILPSASYPQTPQLAASYAQKRRPLL